jgi:hypothetical protein
MAQGDANKMWVVPSEFSRAFEGLSKLAGGDGGESPSWLRANSEVDVPAPELDTSDWFDSNLPPAAEQPEAINLRASDADPDTLAAHSGLPPEGIAALPVPEMPPVPEIGDVKPDLGKAVASSDDLADDGDEQRPG